MAYEGRSLRSVGKEGDREKTWQKNKHSHSCGPYPHNIFLVSRHFTNGKGIKIWLGTLGHSMVCISGCHSYILKTYLCNESLNLT